MSFSPDRFLSHVSKHGDLAQPSKFRVRILPTTLQGRNTITPDIARELELQCESTELPGLTIDALESKVYGPSWFIAQQSSYNELTLVFTCMQDMWEKKFFDNWLFNIIPVSQYGRPDTTPFVEYRDNYTAKIFVEQMSTVSSAKPTYCVVLEDAFPTGLTPLNLNWGDADGVHKLSVSFRYTKWKRADQLIGTLFPRRQGAGRNTTPNITSV